MASPACSNPLYLLVLVTELCQFGDFFQLNAKIEEYLAAPTSIELFALVLARLDADTAQPGPSVAHAAAAHVLQARSRCSGPS